MKFIVLMLLQVWETRHLCWNNNSNSDAELGAEVPQRLFYGDHGEKHNIHSAVTISPVSRGETLCTPQTHRCKYLSEILSGKTIRVSHRVCFVQKLLF